METPNFTAIGLLAMKVQNYRYGVPRCVITELLEHKQSLAVLIGDKRLGGIASNLSEVVSLLINYCTELNLGDKTKAAELMRHVERQWDANDKVIYAMLEKEGG